MTFARENESVFYGISRSFRLMNFAREMKTNENDFADLSPCIVCNTKDYGLVKTRGQ